MSRVYDQADYEGVVDDMYHKYVFFAERAALIDANFPGRRSETTFIAGCGWGFLLEELDALGWGDLWGMDGSEYAVNDRAFSVLTSSLANRVFQGDITVQQDIQDARNRLGRPRFIVTEDVLPTADSEAEAQTMLTNLRDLLHPQGEMMHIVTPRDSKGVLQSDGSVAYPWGTVFQMPGLLWRSPAEWRTLIGPDERIWVTGSYTEVA